ncbi:MAG: flagellar motor protein MotB, partial [Chitinophagaceae bacterium]
MRTLSLLTIALLFAFTGQAQFAQDYYKAANEYYAKGDYYSAAQYFEKYLSGGKGKSTQGYKPYTVSAASGKAAAKAGSREQAVYKAAESYRHLNYFEKAEPLYREASAYDKTQFPLATYWHGTSLRALEKYAEAEQAFVAFKQQYTQQDQYSAAADREIQNLRFIQQQLARKDLRYFTVNKITTQADTGATYAPVWTNNQTLLLTSTRPEAGAGKTYTNRIYEATYAGGAITAVNKASVAQPKDVHQGVTAITPDGNTLYFTRWTIGEGKKTASIFSSKRDASGWSEPAPVATLNVAGTNTQQPAITPDGKKLLFASDRPGGLGGFDLYSAELNADGS